MRYVFDWSIPQAKLWTFMFPTRKACSAALSMAICSRVPEKSWSFRKGPHNQPKDRTADKPPTITGDVRCRRRRIDECASHDGPLAHRICDHRWVFSDSLCPEGLGTE